MQCTMSGWHNVWVAKCLVGKMFGFKNVGVQNFSVSIGPERKCRRIPSINAWDKIQFYSELLEVADVQTHACAKILSIGAKFVFLNAKQKKQALFYDFGTV